MSSLIGEGEKLEIFFKGEEKDGRNHAEQSKAFLDKMVEIFGNGESEIQVYVNKEHKFMDDKMQDIFRQADDYGENIDPVFYGPVVIRPYPASLSGCRSIFHIAFLYSTELWDIRLWRGKSV